jgi:hypothetical protein
MRARTAIGAFAIAGATGLLATFSLGQEMLLLVPQDPVPAYDAEAWSHDDPPDIVLPPDRAVPIIACTSDKSDVRIAVVFDGGVYHVAAGNYVLHRRRASIAEAWTNPRATMSCRGLFGD